MDSPPSPTPAETSGVPRGPFLQRLAAYQRLWILSIGLLVLDQLSKAWIVAKIPYAFAPLTWPPLEAIAIVPGFFHLVHVGNTGAAWSLFEGNSLPLAALAAFTLGAIYIWRRYLELNIPRVQLAFGLLCGGICGNLIDRLRYNHVVDFLDFHFGSYIYPTFNLADAGICIGAVLYVYHSFREPTQTKKP